MQQTGAESRSSGRSSDSDAQAVGATNTSDGHLAKDYHYQEALLTGATLDRHCDAMKSLMAKNHRKCRVHGTFGLGKDWSVIERRASSMSTRHQLLKHSATNSRAGNRSVKNAALSRSNDVADDAMPSKRPATVTAAADSDGPPKFSAPIDANAPGGCHVERRRARKPAMQMWPPFSGSLSRVQQTNASHGRTNTNVVLPVLFLLQFIFNFCATLSICARCLVLMKTAISSVALISPHARRYRTDLLTAKQDNSSANEKNEESSSSFYSSFFSSQMCSDDSSDGGKPTKVTYKYRLLGGVAFCFHCSH